jgi:hypothetical protein
LQWEPALPPEKESSKPSGLLYVLAIALGTLLGRASRNRSVGSSVPDNPIPEIKLKAELHTPGRVELQRTANEDRNYRLQLWLTVGTWLAFIAAAIYAGITYKMLREMRDSGRLQQRHTLAAEQSVGVLRESMTYEEQGWLSIEVNPQGSVGHYVVSVRYSGGNTPVSVTGASVCRSVGSTKEIPSVNFDDVHCGRSNGGNVFNQGSFPIYEGEAAKDFPKIGRSYIQGRVTYTDYVPDSRPHETTACFYYVPGALDGSVRPTTPIFAMCDGHNSMK